MVHSDTTPNLLSGCMNYGEVLVLISWLPMKSRIQANCALWTVACNAEKKHMCTAGQPCIYRYMLVFYCRWLLALSVLQTRPYIYMHAVLGLHLCCWKWMFTGSMLMFCRHHVSRQLSLQLPASCST